MITVSGPRGAGSIQSPDAQCSQCLASRARLVHVSAQTSVIDQALIHSARTGPQNPHSHSWQPLPMPHSPDSGGNLFALPVLSPRAVVTVIVTVIDDSNHSNYLLSAKCR